MYAGILPISATVISAVLRSPRHPYTPLFQRWPLQYHMIKYQHG